MIQYLQRINILIAIIVMILGGVVLTGWYFDNHLLIQISPNWAPMQFNTALCFILAGSTLLNSWLKRRMWLTTALASVLTALAAITMVEYISGWNFGLDTYFVTPTIITHTSHPGRMSPITSICFILVGMGFLIGNNKCWHKYCPVVIASLACITMGFCLTAIFGYITGLTGVQGWGQLTRMALHTSMGMLLLGVAVFNKAYKIEYNITGTTPRWLPIPIVTGSLTATIAITIALDNDHHNVIQNNTEISARAVTHAIELDMGSRIVALERMAQRWTFGKRPDKLAWQHDAMNYYHDSKGYQAIEWVDADYIIRWVAPQEGNEFILNLDLSKEERRKNALNLAMKSKLPTMTPPVSLVQGGKGVLVYIPLYKEEIFDGFILGVFNTRELLNSILHSSVAPGYEIQIHDSAERFYSRTSANWSADIPILQEIDLALYGRNWQIKVWPSAELLSETATPFPLATLIAGIFSTGLLGTSVYFSQRFKLKANEIAQTNDKLQTEIAERVRIEEELQKTSLFQKAILNSSNYAIIATTVDGIIVSFNSGAEHMLGYQAAEVLGQCTPDIFHERDEVVNRARELSEELDRPVHPGFETFIAKTRHGMTDEHEWTYVRKNGSRFPVLLSVTALIDAQDNIHGYLGVGMDITERQKQKVELARARDSALESARLKSEFLANMSHEIRTPMNGVIGMVNILLHTSLSPEQKTQAETIRNSAESLLVILNDILDFSKIEAGKLTYEIHDFNLRLVAEESIALLSGQAKAKGLEMAAILYRDVPVELQGDAGRLRQVLTNLIGNAVKFTTEGEVILRVKMLNVTDNQTTLRFSITDTGMGITPEGQQRLFQVFSQADGSITRKYGGTGLGLAISKQLVAHMKGEIGVNSEYGKGSEFWFTAIFPRQQMVPVRESNPLAGVRLLLVDGKASTREMVQQQVCGWGMVYEEVGNASDALKALSAATLKGNPITMTVIDNPLPDATAMELVSAMMHDPHITRSKIILLDSNEEMAILRKQGVDALLQKPFNQSQLLECLQQVTSGPMEVELDDSPPPQSLASNSPQPSSIKILLAEDNEVNRMVATGMLKQLGYTVDTANDGEVAIERLTHKEYDIILMDCHMPKLDGHHATMQIRDMERSNTLKRKIPVHIIAMTADAMVGDRERCLASGMNDYLSKPVRHAELEAALARGIDAIGSRSRVNKPQEDSTNDTSSENTLVDWSNLTEITQFHPEDLPGFIEFILKQLQEEIPLLEKFFLEGNLTKTREKSHKLYGSCAQIGLKRLASTLRKMEINCPVFGSIEAEELLKAFLHSHQETIAVLKDRLREIT